MRQPVPYGQACRQGNGAVRWADIKSAQCGGTLTDRGGYVCPIGGAAMRKPSSLGVLTMFALKVTARLAALFGGSLAALFVGTLAIEDQRHFVACRASGASADACLLQIQGR